MKRETSSGGGLRAAWQGSVDATGEGGGGEISSGPGFGMVEAVAGGGGPAAATPPEWRAEGGIGKLFASFCDGMNHTQARYT